MGNNICFTVLVCSVETLSKDVFVTKVTNIYWFAYLLYAGSESNHSMLTLDGIDVMGSRLADEVCSGIYIDSYSELFPS